MRFVVVVAFYDNGLLLDMFLLIVSAEEPVVSQRNESFFTFTHNLCFLQKNNAHCRPLSSLRYFQIILIRKSHTHKAIHYKNLCAIFGSADERFFLHETRQATALSLVTRTRDVCDPCWPSPAALAIRALAHAAYGWPSRRAAGRQSSRASLGGVN